MFNFSLRNFEYDVSPFISEKEVFKNSHITVLTPLILKKTKMLWLLKILNIFIKPTLFGEGP